MNTETSSSPVFTVGVGGAAGDGIREAGVHLGELTRRIGCHAFLAFYYPSLIRGGHNFARVSYSGEKVHADHAKLDMLLAVNADSVRIRQSECTHEAIIVVEETYLDEARRYEPRVLALPMNAVAKELNAPHAAAPSVGIGAFARSMGLSRDEFAALSGSIFSDLVGGTEMNTALALRGFDLAAERAFPIRTELRPGTCVGATGGLIEGNKAVAKGLLAAGLQFFVGYPMTPSTSILTFLAKESATKHTIKVVHPEDEIAVANMALGTIYAGLRTAIGTANGGFALMQETFSFAGVSELPFVAVVSQRQGPATGVATHTGQSDLRFVIHAGHGEFPRLVIAPGDVEECFEAGVAAMNMAWKYQTPAIVLLDKHISESQGTTVHDMESSRIGETLHWSPESQPDYKRFTITDSGVSPIAFPGMPGAHVKATSYEHDEFGSSVDDAREVLAMQDKRWRKYEGMKSEFGNYETIKVYGDTSASTALVFWGSTKGAVLEAMKYMKTPVRLLQVIWMEPFDEAAVSAALSGATRVIVIEGNHGAQLAGLIREKTGIAATETVNRYDSEPFEPEELAAELRRRLEETA